MTRSSRQPNRSRRTMERHGGGGAENNNQNDEYNAETDDAVAPAAAAQAADPAAHGRRSLRSSRQNNASAASSSNNNDGGDGDAKEASSGSKRKRTVDSSDPATSSNKQARHSRSKAAASAAAAAGTSSSTPKHAGKANEINRRKRNNRSDSHNDPPPPPAAAVAAANDGGDNILDAFCRMLAQGAPQDQPSGPPPPINPHIAALVLEAAAGNLALAVNLYWDNYFATVNNEHPAELLEMPAEKQPEDAEQKAAAKTKKIRKRNAPEAAAAARREGQQDTEASDAQGGDGDRKPPARAGRPDRERRRAEEGRARLLRRSLDPDFRSANNAEAEQGQGDEPGEEEPAAPNNEPDSAGEGEESFNADHDNEENDAPPAGEAIVMNRANNNNDGSISVSDDEAPGRFARVRFGHTVRANVGRLSDLLAVERKIRDAAAAISRKVLNYKDDLEPKKKRRDREDDDVLKGNPEDYICDSDWLELQKTSALEVLWGGKDTPGGTTEERNNANDTNNNVSGGNENNNNNNDVGQANPINVEEENESDASVLDGSEGAGIPYTWLNDGFHLSGCGTGLVVRKPTEEDIELLAWRQRNAGSRRNALPPPIHCMGTTSVLSVVTSLLYTGASIQGNVVNCTSAKTSWSRLSEEEKTMQFEDRLTDALSALLHIAAEASRDRKWKALKLLRKRVSEAEQPSAEDKEKIKKMKDRLNLVPTCVWEDDLTATLARRTPDGPATRKIPIKISWTNIQDIRLYVLSSIRLFTSKGGIALFLETLVRIHGVQVINRRLKSNLKCQTSEADQAAASSGGEQHVQRSGFTALIRCSCEERQNDVFGGKPVPPSIRNDPSKLIQKLTPPGTNCVFEGLVFLMLCGDISSWCNDCLPKGLGIGLLNDTPGLSLSLSRPERPVWVVKGPTCYSMLFMEEGKDFDKKLAARIDDTRSSIHLCHWNPWYFEPQKCNLRVITGPVSEASSMLQQQLLKVQSELKSRPSIRNRMVLERNRLNLVNTISADQHQEVQKKITDEAVTTAEIERVHIHPEDKKLYPNKRQMWRYDMGEDESSNLDQKPRADRWIAYHRLTEREKRIIELKLGPKINHILWTRWPAATVDTFSQDPVV